MKSEISEISKKYIEEVLSVYTEVFEPIEEILGRCIIHMYPKEDTTPDNGDVNGFVDAFNCEVHIYDVAKKIKYISRYHDDIQVDKPCGVRIFKDGSTMITISNTIQIHYFHSMSVTSK